MKHFKEGDTICTGRIKGDRYEIKRATDFCCGSDIEGLSFCYFFDKGSCEGNGGFPLCSKHNIYFVKINER